MTQTFLDDEGKEFQAPMVLTLSGRYSIPVESIEVATREAMKYRDTVQITRSRYYSVFAGRIFAKGRQIARIHYDGEVETFCLK